MKTISSAIVLSFASLAESRGGDPDTASLLNKFKSYPYNMSDEIEMAAMEDTSGGNDELGKASSLFSGPVEVVSEDQRFRWLESPIWSESGKYLLFSDVKGHRNDDDTDIACGVLYKYDDTLSNLTQLIKCSGIVGPPGHDVGEDGLPSDMVRLAEGGSNGLFWEKEGDGILLMQQHGWKRTVRLNVNDIGADDGSIDPDLVTVVADTFNGDLLNSPNDLVIGGDGYLYLTDPPYGLQYNDVEDPFPYSFDVMTQDKPAVYRIGGDSMQLERLLEYDVAEDFSERAGPNGIARNDENGDLAVVITDWNNPRTEIYSPNEDGTTFNPEPTKILLHDQYRIKGPNASLGALVDGLTYDADMRVFFISAPGGISIYEAFDQYQLLGFIRIDDLCSNNVVGGGFLWMTCNQRLLRIPLAEVKQENDVPTSEDEDGEDFEMFDTSSASSRVSSISLVYKFMTALVAHSMLYTL